MPTHGESEVTKKLTVLQKKFHQQLPGKIAEIECMWEEVANDEDATLTLKEFHRLIHSLAGSGGTFGATSISKTAQDLEFMLMGLLDNPEITPPFSGDIQQKANDLILKIRQAINEWAPSDTPYP